MKLRFNYNKRFFKSCFHLVIHLIVPNVLNFNNVLRVDFYFNKNQQVTIK